MASAEVDPEITRYTTLYSGNRTGWHRPDVNPALVKFIDLLNPPSPDTSTIRKIFVPLCGKSVDIPYLLGLGFHVFGIEGVQQAIEDLNLEHSLNLKYDAEKSVYHTEDNNLVIFHGDIFKCPIETWAPFQAVWDRGSFGTVAYDHRSKYIDVIRRGLQQEPFRYLLEAFEYKKELKSDPPRAFSTEDIQLHFGDWASAEVLQRAPVTQRFLSRHTELIRQECSQNVYLIKPLFVQDL